MIKKKLIIIGILIVIFIVGQHITSQTLPCANSISCVKDLSGTYNPARTSGEFMGRAVSVPLNLFQETNAVLSVLGTQNHTKEKKIFVNLTTQQLYAYEGNRLVHHFTISSGRWNPTPVGKFYIWIKLLATNMEGGEKENNTYYNLPNVPYTMYFYNENVGKWNGYGIHGAYWPMRYGQAMSQGCVVLSVTDAEKLYRWADPVSTGTVTQATSQNPGTPIIIFGKAPL